MNFASVKDITIPSGGLKKIEINDVVVWEKKEEPVATNLCFTAQQANSTVGLSKIGTPKSWVIEKSNDNVNWSSYTLGTLISLNNVGDKIYFRGDIGNASVWVDSSNRYQFTMSGKISASGSCNSLIGGVSSLKDYQFYLLFLNCAALTEAPELPSLELADFCYYGMFYGCTSLVAAPDLPATVLKYYCYLGMFADCTSLVVAPDLPATVLAELCYSAMFDGCVSLTTPPSLPATILAEGCYSAMFIRCSSLQTVPALPATYLESECYQSMFYGCSSLGVYTAAGTGHTSRWNIPGGGKIVSSTLAQNQMFDEIKSDSNVPTTFPGVKGQQYSYYVKNAPV